MQNNTVKNVVVNKGNIRFSTKQLVMIGFLGAISTVLMFFEFPVPLSPTFVKMDFQNYQLFLVGL